MHDLIPPHAQKVFSWVRTDIYQWDQEMYDGSHATFERARFLDGSFAIALTPEKKILLTKQEQPARPLPFLSLPGGAFDSPQEDPLICAQRELLEETGYTSHDWEHYFTAHGNANVIVYTHFYIAHGVTQSQDILLLDPGEKIELLFLDFEDFLLLSEDPTFIHWPLLPHLFRARLHEDMHEVMKKKFRI